ncbi:MAG TPA: hypothetical protein VLA89_03270 [Gemmatimonadales bacterium]|nr:hypothetical protein [Gemmatimonadales bacterium]
MADETTLQDQPGAGEGEVVETGSEGFGGEAEDLSGSQAEDVEQELTGDEGAQAEGEAGQEEDDDLSYLPTEQEKVFPEEVYLRYAKRYPGAAEVLTNPDADPQQKASVRQLLHDKINSDILLKQNQSAEQESEAAETEAAAAPQQLPPEEQEKQHQQFVEHIATNVLSQQKVATLGVELGKGLLSMFGVNPNTKEGKVFYANVEKNGAQLGQLLARMLVDGSLAMSPYIAQRGVGQAFPEFGEMHGDAYNYRTLHALTNSPKYKSLGDPNSAEFRSAYDKAKSEIPNFNSLAFTDEKTGRLLNRFESTPKRHEMVLDRMLGQAPSKEQTEAVRRANLAGRKSQEMAQNKKQLGNLGAGQSTGQVSKQRSGNDDIFGEGAEMVRRRGM